MIKVPTPEDGMRYWVELAKSFGLPFAMCCAMMLGFWLLFNKMLDQHQTETTQYKAEQIEDKKTIIELAVQGNQALDKVGDATIDVGKGLEELKDQGEKIEEAVNKLSDAINDRESP